MTATPQNNSPNPPRWAGYLIDLLAVGALAAIAFVASQSLGNREQAATSTAMPVSDRVDLCQSVDDAFLSGTLYGAIDRVIEWRGTDMTCEGGPRPDGDGVRLVFAAPAREGARLVFVIAISGAIGELRGAEHPANLTVIDEASGRFFSAGGQERCWTNVSSVDGDDQQFRIGGEVYCSGSLPSLSDSSSISLRDFRYSGRLTLDAS